ncbi:MAG: alpha/beta hydrolase-fold protein [Brachymonas sp.]|nr:alpha/beta hydrolase-fold protein [Brachymonas sp.]
MQVTENVSQSPAVSGRAPVPDFVSTLSAQAFNRRQALLYGSSLALGSSLSGRAAACTAASALPATPYTTPAPAADQPSSSQQFDLVDEKGHKRRIFVASPSHAAPADGYPVLYTLDGNALFGLFTALALLQAARPDAGPAPAPAIVGIGYPIDAAYDQPARERDYTFSQTKDGVLHADGADRFLDFVQGILQPQLAQHLPLNPQRQALFGHSYGGLLVLYALFTRPGMFHYYTAASPSIWRSAGAIWPCAENFANQPFAAAMQAPYLLLTAGSLEENTPQRSLQRQRRQQQRRMVTQVQKLANQLQHHPAVHSRFVLLHDEDHGGTAIRSAYLALHDMMDINNMAAGTNTDVPMHTKAAQA